MAVYTLGVRTPVAATDLAMCEIRATSANKPRVVEFAFTQNTAPGAAATFGLGRPAAVGLAPTTAISELDETDGNAGSNALASIATAWGTQPTVPTNFMRRVTLATAAGIGVMWVFPRGLGLPVSGSVVLWCISATSSPSSYDVWAAVDE